MNTNNESDKEAEQLQKLDKLRKLAQAILGNHLPLLIISFCLILAAVLTVSVMVVHYSPSRYLARVSLCYLPKQTGKISQYDDKYVLGILKRQTTRTHFLRQHENGTTENVRLAQVARQILIERDRKQPYHFSIQLSAASEEDAVSLINEFAEVCIQEYAQERTQDLNKRKEVLENERKEVENKIQECNNQIGDLMKTLHVISPEKEYDRIRVQLNDFQVQKIRLKIVLDNLTERQKQLEKEMAGINPALLVHQHEIKGFQAELEKLDGEIFTASEIYTEENPKMVALLMRRKAIQKRMDDFLSSKGIQAADNALIVKAEKITAEQKTLLAELDVRQNEMRVLESEIADCRKRFQLLTEYQPKLQNLMQSKKTLQDSRQRLDESISEINYMLLMVSEDLFVNEKVHSAVGSQPFAKKKLAVCIFAAVAITGFLAGLVVLLDFLFGHVANAKELKLYDEFHYLGMLPVSGEMFNSEDLEKTVLNKIFHDFHVLGLHTVFINALPGAKLINDFFNIFEWNLALSGHRMLLMDIVFAEDFTGTPDPGTDAKTIIVTFSGGKCYLPLASKKYLDPSEMELLKSDFNVLKENYDYIFIRNAFPLRHSILFLEQIADFCDGMLFAVGARKTPRKYLRILLSTHLKIKLPVMTVLTEHSLKKLKKELNQEAKS